jgi:hypothetical protein
MAQFADQADGGLRRPASQADLYAQAGGELNMPEWPKQEYIDRAVTQLREAGKLHFFVEWQGWHLPDYEGRLAALRFRRLREQESRMAAARAQHDPDRRRRAGLISKLEAKAESTTFPAEAASLRAKAEQLRAQAWC